MTAAVVVLAVLLAGAVAVAAGALVSLRDERRAAVERRPGRAAEPGPGAEATAEHPAEVADLTGARDDELLLLDRFRDAIDHFPRAVVLWDATGQEVYRNRVADAMFEARDGQVLVAAAIEELMVEALAGRTAHREVDLFGPPAASFVVVAEPFRISESGLLDGAVALVEDRSQQRRTETVRRDFIANISHELKTPIGALGLLAETLRDEPDLTVVGRLSERMIAEADRLGRTVDDLLELSSIELGDDTEFDDLDVRSLVGEADSRLGPAAEQVDVSVRVEVDHDLVVRGDRRQLVSALYNLLDNAVKYSPDGSEVVVVAARDDDTLRITVRDSGIGVPRRDLDRIFERFYRVDRARSRRTGGTGLGLAIVRHVAANHGGEVVVESTEGVGSAFTLVLPAVGGEGSA